MTTGRHRQNYTFEGYHPDDGLPEDQGRWMAGKHGILRWVGPIEHTPPAVELVEDAPPRALIACPTCRALINESCKTRNGHRRSHHKERLMDRVCPCGSPAQDFGLYCEPCAELSKRRNWRESKRRARARKESAA